jgi:hypothetical protein
LPDNRSMDSRSTRKPGWLPPWMDRLISGKAPSDPLYLSNRTTIKRLKPWIAVGLFFVALSVGWKIAVPHTDSIAPPPVLVSKIAAIPSPQFDTSRLEVVDVGVVDNGARLVGTVKNKTGHVIAVGRLSFELQDNYGQFTGATGTDLKQIPPGIITRFELPIRQPDSRRVLVTGISVE